MKNSGIIISILIFSCLLCLCQRPSEENANLDKAVGIGNIAGASISTGSGLAAIRSLEPGTITFWLQAPVQIISLDLTSSSISSWRIILLNAMPGTYLQDPGAVTAYSESQAGTTYTIDLLLDTGLKYEMTFAPNDYSANDTYSFAMMADVQEAIDEVDDIYNKINQYADIRFVICVGDLTSSGTKSEYNDFISKMRILNIPLFATPGNHDYMTGEPENWHHKFGRFNVHFWFKGAAFSLIDSSSGTIDPIVYDWLKQWVKSSKSIVHLFFTHYPPIDPVGIRSGSFKSRNEAYKLLAILADGNVDVNFFGHIHTYYEYTNAGIPSYISGGGGAIPDRFDNIGRHFLKVTVDPQSNSCSVKRIDAD